MILGRALDLWAARGYAAVGVQELCEAGGVTKPTLYYYFGSKHGVLEALLERYAGPLLEDLRGPSTYRGDLTWCLEESARVFAGLGAGIIKFAGLADDDGAGTDYHDLVDML